MKTKNRKNILRILCALALLNVSTYAVNAQDLNLVNKSFSKYAIQDPFGSRKFFIKDYDNISVRIEGLENVYDPADIHNSDVSSILTINAVETPTIPAKHQNYDEITVTAKNIEFINENYHNNIINLYSQGEERADMLSSVKVNIGTPENPPDRIYFETEHMLNRPGMIELSKGYDHAIRMYAKEIILKAKRKNPNLPITENLNRNIFGVYYKIYDSVIFVEATDRIEIDGNITNGYAVDFVGGPNSEQSGTNIVINPGGKDHPDVIINGDIHTGNYEGPTFIRDNGIEVRMDTPNSVFNGKAINHRNGQMSLIDNGGINLQIENGAQWNMTGASAITMLTLSNKAIVNLPTPTTRFEGLNIGNLYGDKGIFALNINAEGSKQRNFMTVEGVHRGNHYIKLNNLGANAEGAQGAGLIYVHDEKGDFNALDNDDKIFLEKYVLKPYKATDPTKKWQTIWYLDKIKITPEKTNIIQEVEKSLEDRYQGITAQDSLYKRLGHYNPTEDNTWVRTRKEAFNEQEIGFSIGHNKALGFGFGHKNSLNLYDTKIKQNGVYIDNVFGINRLSSTINSADKTASLTQYGFKLSSEIGQKKELSNNCYLIPQAQLSYNHVFNKKYMTSNNIEIEEKALDSLVLRLGVHYGKKIEDKLDIYTKVDLLTELFGKQRANYHKENQYGEFSKNHNRTWLEYALGINYKASDSINVYGEIGNNKKYTVGLRYIW